jgi:hypothetical protein
MSRKEVRDATHPAKNPKTGDSQPTFLDHIKATKKTSAGTAVNFYYGPNGKLVEDSEVGFAYYVQKEDGTKSHFVKFGTAGAAMGRILNVNGMYYKPGDEKKYETNLARKTYEYRKVSEAVFNLYLKFLQSKNEKYILQAEREIVNG